MNQPEVSIVINCYNGAEYLQQAIDSVYAQTFTDWEIIFFDNASTDESAQIAKSYNEKIKYHYSETLLPLGDARNKAIQLTTGKYVCFLDCDDLWDTQKLEKQLACFKQVTNNTIGLCYTLSYRIANNGDILSTYTLERTFHSGDIYKKLIQDCFFACSSVMVDKSILLEVGGFDSSWSQVEDWDLWLKIAKRFEVVYVPEFLTKIRIHENNNSRDFNNHFEEKISLLKRLKEKDKSVVRLCQLMIRRLSFHKDITSALLAKDFFKRFKYIALILYHAIVHPTDAIFTLRKYFKWDMFKLFMRKFAKA